MCEVAFVGEWDWYYMVFAVVCVFVVCVGVDVMDKGEE